MGNSSEEAKTFFPSDSVSVLLSSNFPNPGNDSDPGRYLGDLQRTLKLLGVAKREDRDGVTAEACVNQSVGGERIIGENEI